MRIPYYQIDAFTNAIFSGNPAGVCLLRDWFDESRLLAIAAENNLSETAFLVRIGEDYELRWFTPEIEVDLCGHATLASAFVVFNYIDRSRKHVRFESKSGLLEVVRENDLLVMDFPSRKARPCAVPDELVTGLGIQPSDVLRARDYLAVYTDEEQIKAIRPNAEELLKLNSLGIIVTAPGTQSDFVSRFFAPSAGILEDPVTGSAHCTLTPYWAKKLRKSRLHALQLSKRGGEIFCSEVGDRIKIAGRAVRYLEGTITL